MKNNKGLNVISSSSFYGYTVKPAGYQNEVLMWRVPGLGGNTLYPSVGKAKEAILEFLEAREKAKGNL
jgi:hypothetical protein